MTREHSLIAQRNLRDVAQSQDRFNCRALACYEKEAKNKRIDVESSYMDSAYRAD